MLYAIFWTAMGLFAFISGFSDEKQSDFTVAIGIIAALVVHDMRMGMPTMAEARVASIAAGLWTTVAMRDSLKWLKNRRRRR